MTDTDFDIAIDNLIDMRQFDPREVFKLQVQVVQYVVDGRNASETVLFRKRLANARKNWVGQGLKLSYAPPVPVQKMDVDWDSETIRYSEGPELVVDPVPRAPWDEVKEEPIAGTVAFGPPIGGYYGGYYDAGSNVPLGHVATHPDGVQYYFHVYQGMGAGAVTKVWLPVIVG